MKVLFAVSNDKMSESIIRQYQKDYKQIISYKNVYYFNAILKELQRDKTYERIVISEDLEQYVNSDYEQRDKFLFDKLDSISDEASNMNGEDIPIILICTERRTKSEPILVKLFGIGIYNAIIGTDRSVTEVCRLINRPRSKKEAKIYYKIDSEDVTYEKEDENDVSELEIQNILAHYKRLGNDVERYVESFDSIAAQYNDVQLRVISKCLPLNVRAVLEEMSPKYQEINSYNNKISDKVRTNKKQENLGTSEILLKSSKTSKITEPVVVPSAIDTTKKRKIISTPEENVNREFIKPQIQEEQIPDTTLPEIELDDLPEIEDIPETEFIPEESMTGSIQQDTQEIPAKRKRGRPRKIITEPVEQAPKRKRGRPRKNVEPEETILPGVHEEEENILPGFEEDGILPGMDMHNDSTTAGAQSRIQTPSYETEEDAILPGFGEQEIDTQYTNVLRNLQEENEKDTLPIREENKEVRHYEELNMQNLISPNQKIVSFVGTSKNGTSFLINNVAEILSMNGIDTAILDLTHNRNAYYIYTKNEDQLREQSNHIMQNLVSGQANGIIEHKNLTIYTSPFEDDEELQNVEPIVETLVRNHTVVLMDCDFTTPMRYFKYAQEIYLVQSMDILTIQPLTAFLRQLSDKNMFEPSKARVVLNKFARTRVINEEILVGGISIYNDASMTVRKELFNRRTVDFVTIPFDLKTYFSYLDGLAVCDVSIKGYSKELMQSLKNLTNMIYPIQKGGRKSEPKYMPPSVRNNNTFSSSMNNTLNQMKRNY